ncbi:hypothetical protein [Nocardia abscessus]|uniref:hypothetical protein n=1 Tax=Nocardia abscessus TaxID=120957 RepID=UPI0018940761|nr:hypothetical protein [Nocardia abscessus]
MPASPELLAARAALEPALPGIDGVTGIDIGFADEEARDPDDLAVRVFVRDASSIPAVLDDVIGGGDMPIRVIQRTFEPTAAFDTSAHRPVVGGVSVGAARFVATGNFPVGTLGAIGRTTTTFPPMVIGLSNHHVLAHDGDRNFGDEIIQPEPTPFGRVPNDLIGRLLSWEFPEIVYSGIADAAICSIDLPTVALPSITDIGLTAGTRPVSLGLPVTKRGRTTGVTHGIVTTDSAEELFGTYYVDYKHLPPVNNPLTAQPTIARELKNQVQVMIDFPQSAVFGEEGDSGSVVVDGANRIVGLYFAGGYDAPGNPIRFGLMTPISVIEQALGISFSLPT